MLCISLMMKGGEHSMSTKQKTGLAWAIIIIAWFGGVALATAQNKVPPIMPTIMDAFGITESTAGWLTSVFTIIGMATAIPAAGMVRKMGTKMTGTFALGCATLGSLLGVFAHGLTFLMITRIIEGIGVGLIAVVGPVIISEWFPPEKRGGPMGLWGAWMGTSQTLLFLIGGTLVAKGGWQAVWWFSFIFCAIILVLWTIRVSSPPEGTPNYADADPAEGAVNYKLSHGFKSLSTWLVTIIGITFTFACFGFSTFISYYWNDKFYGSDPMMAQSNLKVTILYAIEILVCILLGMVLDRIVPHKRKWFGCFGAIFYAVLIFFCFRINAPGLVMFYVIAFPIAESFIPVTYFTIAPSTAKHPMYAGLALGILNVGLNLGTLLGPPVVGKFYETSPAAATIPMTIAIVILVICFALIKTYDDPKDWIDTGDKPPADAPSEA